MSAAETAGLTLAAAVGLVVIVVWAFLELDAWSRRRRRARRGGELDFTLAPPRRRRSR